MPHFLNEETAKLDHHGRCPECNASWDGGDVFETLRTQNWCKDMTDKELRAYVHKYYSPPYRFSRLIGVERPYGDPKRYDGVSLWCCPDCAHKWNRFKEDE
jgi:rubredoxin